MTVRLLTLLPDGAVLPVRPGETIDAALVRCGFVRRRRGCRRGGCGQCMVTLVEGETFDERAIADTVLSAQQRAEGRILVCRAVPTTDVVVAFEPDQVRLVSPIQLTLARRELGDTVPSDPARRERTSKEPIKEGSAP